MGTHDLERAVFISRHLPDAGIALLIQAGLKVRVNPRARFLRPEELRRELGRCDAAICQFGDRMDEATLSAARPRCRIVATATTGYDHIDVGAAKRLGIIVTHTPDVLTESVADLTWGLILGAARRLSEAERVLRAGGWRGWGMMDFLGTDVHGKTLGIVGGGRIGTAVARRASGFAMTVVYHSRRPSEAIERLGARRVALHDLLATSDFVSLHVPLTPETRHLINAGALAQMKRGAILINTARGPVVDEEALAEALRDGQLAGAGLDVYEKEPAVRAELLAMENVVLLPHIGSATVATRSRMAEMAAANVVEVLSGRAPLNPIPFAGA